VAVSPPPVVLPPPAASSSAKSARFQRTIRTRKPVEAGSVPVAPETPAEGIAEALLRATPALGLKLPWLDLPKRKDVVEAPRAREAVDYRAPAPRPAGEDPTAATRRAVRSLEQLLARVTGGKVPPPPGDETVRMDGLDLVARLAEAEERRLIDENAVIGARLGTPEPSGAGGESAVGRASDPPTGSPGEPGAEEKAGEWEKLPPGADLHPIAPITRDAPTVPPPPELRAGWESPPKSTTSAGRRRLATPVVEIDDGADADASPTSLVIDFGRSIPRGSAPPAPTPEPPEIARRVESALRMGEVVFADPEAGSAVASESAAAEPVGPTAAAESVAAEAVEPAESAPAVECVAPAAVEPEAPVAPAAVAAAVPFESATAESAAAEAVAPVAPLASAASPERPVGPDGFIGVSRMRGAPDAPEGMEDVSWLDDDVVVIIERQLETAHRSNAPAPPPLPAPREVPTTELRVPTSEPPLPPQPVIEPAKAEAPAEAAPAGVASVAVATAAEPAPREDVLPGESPAIAASVVPAVGPQEESGAAVRAPAGPAAEPKVEIEAGVPSHRAEPAVAEEPPPPPEPARVAEPKWYLDALDRYRTDPGDLDALRQLCERWITEGLSGPAWIGRSILGLCDARVPIERPPAPEPQPLEKLLERLGPWEAGVLHRAMGIVWEHCSGSFLQNTASREVRPSDQVSPLGSTRLARGISEVADTLGFFRFQVYRRNQGDKVEVVRTRPPSVVVGPALDPSQPGGLARLALGVAVCAPEHVLPMTLEEEEREGLLRGLLTAFGPPGRIGKLSSGAAQIAQDLWHFLPARAQTELRQELAGADTADFRAWPLEVQARCLLVAVHVSRDVLAGLRLAFEIETGIRVEGPLPEETIRWTLAGSPLMRLMLSLLFDEKFWDPFWR
jgi:hypothetical protein